MNVTVCKRCGYSTVGDMKVCPMCMGLNQDSYSDWLADLGHAASAAGHIRGELFVEEGK